MSVTSYFAGGCATSITSIQPVRACSGTARFLLSKWNFTRRRRFTVFVLLGFVTDCERLFYFDCYFFRNILFTNGNMIAIAQDELQSVAALW